MRLSSVLPQLSAVQTGVTLLHMSFVTSVLTRGRGPSTDVHSVHWSAVQSAIRHWLVRRSTRVYCRRRRQPTVAQCGSGRLVLRLDRVVRRWHHHNRCVTFTAVRWHSRRLCHGHSAAAAADVERTIYLALCLSYHIMSYHCLSHAKPC